MLLIWKLFANGDTRLRHFMLAALLGLSVFVTSGCKKAVLRSQLKELMASTVVLPDSITCVNNGVVYPMPDRPSVSAIHPFPKKCSSYLWGQLINQHIN